MTNCQRQSLMLTIKQPIQSLLFFQAQVLRVLWSWWECLGRGPRRILPQTQSTGNPPAKWPTLMPWMQSKEQRQISARESWPLCPVWQESIFLFQTSFQGESKDHICQAQILFSVCAHAFQKMLVLYLQEESLLVATGIVLMPEFWKDLWDMTGIWTAQHSVQGCAPELALLSLVFSMGWSASVGMTSQIRNSGWNQFEIFFADIWWLGLRMTIARWSVQVGGKHAAESWQLKSFILGLLWKGKCKNQRRRSRSGLFSS